MVCQIHNAEELYPNDKSSHDIFKKGFLIINNFDLTNFNKDWSIFKQKYHRLDKNIESRHKISHFDISSNNDFLYKKSNEWLIIAEELLFDLCQYTLDIWKALFGSDSAPEYLSHLSFDKLKEQDIDNVYKELEYSYEVHDFMKKKYNYSD